MAGVKFKKLLAHRPDSVPDRLSLGVCFLRIGADEKAYEHFDKIKDDPQFKKFTGSK